MYNVTTNTSYRQALAEGEVYEQNLVKRFRSAGFKSARYAELRQDLREDTVNTVSAGLRWGNWKRLYTLFQRDIWVKVPRSYVVVENGVPKTIKGYKRFNVEVKSRNVKGFAYETMMVGKADNWDNGKFRKDYFVIIDQQTDEARWIDVKATQEAGLWKYVASRHCASGYTTDDHYEVETSLFRPLSELFELLSEMS